MPTTCRLFARLWNWKDYIRARPFPQGAYGLTEGEWKVHLRSSLLHAQRSRPERRGSVGNLPRFSYQCCVTNSTGLSDLEQCYLRLSWLCGLTALSGWFSLGDSDVVADRSLPWGQWSSEGSTGLDVQIIHSRGSKWRSSPSAAVRCAHTWPLHVAWAFHTMALDSRGSALRVNVPRDQSHKVPHDSTCNFCSHFCCSLLVTEGPPRSTRERAAQRHGPWGPGSLRTMFGVSLSQMPNHLCFNNTYFLISSPLNSQKINKEAVLGQYEN